MYLHPNINFVPKVNIQTEHSWYYLSFISKMADLNIWYEVEYKFIGRK